MKLHFGHLLGLAALLIAGCAAFFSVYGIGMLFSGAMLSVIIMGSSLELGKLVAASYLQRYWKKTSIMLKIYLTIAVTLLMAITSGGIYGFLSSAYQETFQKLAMSKNQISFLEQKEKFYADDVARYDKELERISSNISELSNTKVNTTQVRDTSSSTGFRNVITTSGLKIAQERINVEEKNRSDMMVKRSIASDSLQKYQLAILDKQNMDETSAELGPLIYISNLTGVPMDKVVNYFILVFIIVFDPLAVTLVIATNRVFLLESGRKEEELKVENKPKKNFFKIPTIFNKKDAKTKQTINVEPLKQKDIDLVFDEAKIRENTINKSEVKSEDIKPEVKTELNPNNDSIILKAAKTIDNPELKSGVINNQGLVSAQPKEGVKTQITSIKSDGIKREEIKEIRENQNKIKNRGFSRNIPVRRGY